MKRFGLPAAVLVSSCAVFNPNHVALNPFKAPGPCFQVEAPPLWDGTVQDLQMRDIDEAYAARKHARCIDQSGPHFTDAEIRARLKEYEALPGW